MALRLPTTIARAPGRIHEWWRGTIWRGRVFRYLIQPARLRLLAGERQTPAVTLIMCLWSRPQRIDAILEQLAMQSGCPPIRLILWNNNSANNEHYLSRISAFGVRGSIASIEYHNSRANIGGIARFLVARSITHHSGIPFLMLDDDQDVSDRLVADLLAAYALRTYAGFWSFTMATSYWDRVPAPLGTQASYVGTGGSVCDSALVHTRGFFSHLPARYGFIEDLWASRFAASHGWRLRRVDTPIGLLDEDGNQYHALRELKPEFWDYLTQMSAEGRLL